MNGYNLDSVLLIRSLDPQWKTKSESDDRWDDIFVDGEVDVCRSAKIINVVTRSRHAGQLVIGRWLARNERVAQVFPGFVTTRQ